MTADAFANQMHAVESTLSNLTVSPIEEVDADAEPPEAPGAPTDDATITTD